MSKVRTAACLIIGNEILTGKTKDNNMAYLAAELFKNGINLMEARHVRDIEIDIIDAVKALSDKYNYVFTSGGIGPTHDDITTEAIAKAFGLSVALNSDAHAILQDYYKDALNESRLKMAMLPQGAELIKNDVSAAPGFTIRNVFVMAGVPRIFQNMLSHVLPGLDKGDVVHVVNRVFLIPESDLAKPLKEIAKRHEKEGVEIGSYPTMKDGSWVVEIVVRCTDMQIANRVMAEVERDFESIMPTFDTSNIK